ncbi:MAG TPA: serine/threonine-protein kinase [Kofleriaceae bacterium]|nr:serine/threonine-protein kinase [Kofleriaceae bacterium]
MGAERPRTSTAVPGGTPMPDTTQAASAGPGDPPASTWSPSPVASERFQVGAEVARGGMGRVVAARDEQLGRQVAIKEALDGDAVTVSRFEREVHITARLQHPAIVPLYDAGRWPSGLPFYVMRLVSGRSLLERIEKTRSLDERLALVPSFLAAADAVGFAHRERIIHRDLKPANVLVGEHGETLVIDWGLAKVMGEPDPLDLEDIGELTDEDIAVGETISASAPGATRAGAVLGTPGYMAPEQAAGDPVDPRSDVYAMGATLYHLLAGAPPHTAASPTDVIARTLTGPPPPLAGLAPGAPPDLVAIVDKAMAADPDRRYPDGSALAADVRRFLTGQLVAAHRYSQRDRVRRFVRRHRAAFAVGGLAAAVLVVLVAVGLSRIVAARHRAESARADAEAGWRSAEHARERAQDRADDLLLARAQGLLDSDPTAAAGLAARLPLDSAGWSRARALIDAARARGIARSLPGQRGANVALEVDPSGRFLLSLDRDGRVEIHDLESWRSRVIAEGERASGAVWADGGRAVAIARGTGLLLVDVASGRARTIARPGPLADLSAPADASYLAWRDKKGSSALAAAPGWTATPLSTGASGGWLRVSRDGRFLATGSAEEPVRLWRRGQRDPILTGAADCLVSLGARDRAALACSGEVIEWDLSRSPPSVTGRWRAVSPLLIPSHGGDGRLYLTTARGELLALLPGGRIETLLTRSRASFPITTATGVALSSGSESIDLVEGGWTQSLRAPGVQMSRLAVAGGGRLLAGASMHGHILVFDVERVRPRRIRMSPGASNILGVSARSAVVSRASGEIEAVDIASGAVRLVGQMHGFPDRSGSAADGSTVIIASMVGEVAVVRPATGAFELIVPEGASLAALSGPDSAVWSRGRELWEKRLFSGEPARLIATWKADPVAVAASPGWLVGALEDGTIWRRAPSGAIEEWQSGRVPGPGFAIGPDGTVYASAERELLRLRGGRAERLALLSDVVLRLELDPAFGLSAVTADGAVHLVPLAGGAARTTSLTTPVVPIDLSLRGAQAAARDGSHYPVAVDLAGQLSQVLAPTWTMHVAAAADGSSIAALTGGELLLFRRDLPREPAALRAWLARATNARVDDSGAVAWP